MPPPPGESADATQDADAQGWTDPIRVDTRKIRETLRSIPPTPPHPTADALAEALKIEFLRAIVARLDAGNLRSSDFRQYVRAVVAISRARTALDDEPGDAPAPSPSADW